MHHVGAQTLQRRAHLQRPELYNYSKAHDILETNLPLYARSKAARLPGPWVCTQHCPGFLHSALLVYKDSALPAASSGHSSPGLTGVLPSSPPRCTPGREDRGCTNSLHLIRRERGTDVPRADRAWQCARSSQAMAQQGGCLHPANAPYQLSLQGSVKLTSALLASSSCGGRGEMARASFQMGPSNTRCFPLPAMVPDWLLSCLHLT